MENFERGCIHSTFIHLFTWSVCAVAVNYIILKTTPSLAWQNDGNEKEIPKSDTKNDRNRQTDFAPLDLWLVVVNVH